MRVRERRSALLLGVTLVLVVGVLAGCDNAGAGDGDAQEIDSEETTGGDDSTEEVSNGDGADTDDGAGDAGESEEDAAGEGGGRVAEEANEEDARASLDTSDMILHLSFDGDVTDETGTSSDSSITDSEKYGEDRDGNAGSAVEFDGSGYVEVGDVDLSSTTDLTVTAWIRHDNSNLDRYRTIAYYLSSAGSADFVEFSMRIRKLGDQSWEDGSFEAWVENNGANGTRTTERVAARWTHVALVYDDEVKELRLYQDGSLKNSRNVSLSVADGTFRIGGGRSGEEFHGLIDDVAVFTRALSNAEIAQAKDEIGTEGADSASEEEDAAQEDAPLTAVPVRAF